MPDNAANSAGPDVELIARLKVDVWPGPGEFIANKDDWPNSNNRSWNWQQTSLNVLRFYWWPCGDVSCENLRDLAPGFASFPLGTYLWIKLSFDVDNGTGNSVYAVYWAADQEDVPTSWTALAAPVLGPVTSIGDSAASLQLGAGMAANIKYFSFSPTVGGAPTVVFDTTLVPATSPTAPPSTAQVGGTWSLTGSAVWEYVPATPPVNVVLPVITGTPMEGETLTASTGTWTGTEPITYTYQWQICDADGTGCVDISGETGSTYLLTSGDVGHTIVVVVTATNEAGTADAASLPTAVIEAIPIPPIPPDRNLMPRKAGRGRLGCGINRAYITWKCGTPRFCPVLESTEITWNRALNDISEAEVVVPLSGNADDVCCECLGDIEPWCHELHIERDGEDVWLGPVTEIVYEFDKVTIRALDLLGWTTVRIAEVEISNFEIDPAAPDLDMTTIAEEVLNIAFVDDDPCALDYVSALPSGVMGQRIFSPYTDTAFDQLDALAQTGAPEYTVVGRTIILMGPQTPTTPIATLMDEHIIGTVQLTKDGTLQANRWFVHYDDDETDIPPGPGVADAPDRFCYGLLERMKEGTGLPNKTNAEEAGQVLLDATPNATMPRLLEIPEGSQLSPLAPWPLSAMIPGVRVDVAVTRLCVDATHSFRLVGVGVRQDANGEQVTLSLGPLNPLAGEL
jgi:hypothetical protein